MDPALNADVTAVTVPLSINMFHSMARPLLKSSEHSNLTPHQDRRYKGHHPTSQAAHQQKEKEERKGLRPNNKTSVKQCQQTGY